MNRKLNRCRVSITTQEFTLFDHLPYFDTKFMPKYHMINLLVHTQQTFENVTYRSVFY